MASRRSIPAGRTLRTDWFEAPAVIGRGDRVRLVLHAGGMRIEGIGQALSDGAVGEVVRVRNADSRREVHGRVAPDGAVHVVF